MTTRPTDEEIRAMIQTLDLRNGTFKERAMLKAWLAERQAARNGVKDMHLQEVLNILDCSLAHIGTSNFIGLALSKSDIECMRAALQSVARPVRVPDGWRLVPVEPTEAMLDHIAGTRFSRLPPTKQAQEIAAYSRMLSSAPAYNGKKDNEHG